MELKEYVPDIFIRLLEPYLNGICVIRNNFMSGRIVTLGLSLPHCDQIQVRAEDILIQNWIEDGDFGGGKLTHVERHGTSVILTIGGYPFEIEFTLGSVVLLSAVTLEVENQGVGIFTQEVYDGICKQEAKERDQEKSDIK